MYGVTERTVRNWCSQGKLQGAYLIGKTWNIPVTAQLPYGGKKRKMSPLLKALTREKAAKMKGGIYHRVQVDLTYNSNHIEGSQLTHDQTRMIFETRTFSVLENETVRVDDIIETANHFRCIDYIIDNAMAPLSVGLIKQIHRMLKENTSDSRNEWFAVGDYKRLPNEVGGIETTPPEHVAHDMKELLSWYKQVEKKDEECIIEFHQRFEMIHPFQDGNGRVGRLIMFKECLANGIVPFIIDENLRFFYYRGLREWPRVRGYLVDTCLAAQDKFKEVLDYFRIRY